MAVGSVSDNQSLYMPRSHSAHKLSGASACLVLWSKAAGRRRCCGTRARSRAVDEKRRSFPSHQTLGVTLHATSDQCLPLLRRGSARQSSDKGSGPDEAALQEFGINAGRMYVQLSLSLSSTQPFSHPPQLISICNFRSVTLLCICTSAQQSSLKAHHARQFLYRHDPGLFGLRAR
jgi:hypothetical protein